jgi:hypothetical protein
MDRRKALKKRGILLELPSSSTIGVLFESFTLPRMKKIKFFSGTDEEIFEFADIIIPTTKLSRS